MRVVIYVLVISFFIHSCKSELEKIDINNVEAHRAYQDTLMSKDSTDIGKFSILKNLISEYRGLNSKENVSNDKYYYYMSRLYGKVGDFPLKGFWVDTVNNKFLNETDYINFSDSTLYYAEKSLEINKENIRSMYLLCTGIYYDIVRYASGTVNTPYSFNRDKVGWNRRMQYIANNSVRFQKIDTSKDKYLSHGICEIALNFLTADSDFKYGYIFDPNNNEKVNKLILYGQLWDFVKSNEFQIVNFKKEDIQKNVYPNIILAREFLIQKEELERKLQLAKELIENIYHKYSYVSNVADGSKVAGMLTLHSNNDYTQAAIINGFTQSGRGTFYVSGDKLFLNRTSGIAIDGELSISAGTDNKIYLSLSNGVIYIEDDEGYYIKKMIQTPKSVTGKSEVSTVVEDAGSQTNYDKTRDRVYSHESVSTSRIILSYENGFDTHPTKFNQDGNISELSVSSSNTYNVIRGPFDGGKLFVESGGKRIQLFDNVGRSVANYYLNEGGINNNSSSKNKDIVYEGSAKDYRSGVTQDYTLLIKSDFSGASIDGGSYISIQDQGDGTYIWLDGTIIGMSFRPTRDKCVLYGSDGSYFCTLYRR